MSERLRLRDKLKRRQEIAATHIHRPGRIILAASVVAEFITASVAEANAYILFENGKPLWGAVNVGVAAAMIGTSIVSNKIRSESAWNEREIKNFLKNNTDNQEE